MKYYIEDKNIIAKCYKNREYEDLKNKIDEEKSQYNVYINRDEIGVGYKIKEIDSLSRIYKNKFFAVEFALCNYNCKNTSLENIFKEIFINLCSDINKRSGYYILKIPCEFESLLNSFNKYISNTIFTGGTVCYYWDKDIASEININDELDIRKINKSEAEKLKIKLMELSKKSFTNYVGQYHIAEYTKIKAPIIYEEWVESYIDNMKDTLYVAFLKENPVGFLTVESTDFSNEMVLSAVDESVRGRKIYERMIRKCVEDSKEDKKIVTLSTQFNNYLVQRAWINIGFKPYHSFYTFHVNNIRK